MSLLDKFRAKNPEYKDYPDDKLAEGLYNKYYAQQMSREDFELKISPPPVAVAPVEPELPEAEGFLQNAAEISRGITRGAQKTLELGFDIADVPIQAGLAALNPPEGQSPLMAAALAARDQINPFGEETEIDNLRNEYFWKPSEEIRKQQYKSRPATAAEWAFESSIGPGKIASNIATGLFSGAGATIGDDLGGETGQTIGGITGALLSPAKTIQNLTEEATRGLESLGLLKNESKGLEALDSIDADVYKYIVKNATNPKLAIATFNKNFAAGVKGTVADLTEDPKLYNIESAIPKGTSAAENLVNQQDEFAANTLSQIDKTFGTGDSAIPKQNAINQINIMDDMAQKELSDIAEEGIVGQERINRALAATDQGVAGAAGNASAAEIKLAAGTPLSPEASENAAIAFKEAKDLEYAKTVRPAWDNFDEVAGEINGNSAYQIVKDFEKSKDITGTDLLGLKKNKDIYDKINNWVVKKDKKIIGKQIRPSEIQSVVSDIRAKISAANRTGAFDNDLRILGKLADKLDDSLKTGSSISPEAAAAYNSAKKLHAIHVDKFKTGRPGNAALKEPTLFGKNVFVAQDEGKASAKQLQKMLLSNNPDEALAAQKAIESVKTYVRSQANEPGVVTAAWRKRYAPFLNEFKDLREEVDDVVNAKSALSKTKEAQAIVKKQATEQKSALKLSIAAKANESTTRSNRLKNTIQNSNLRKFSEEPKTTINSIINKADNAAENLSALAQQVGDKDGFVRILGDVLKNKTGKWEELRPIVSDVLSTNQLNELDGLISLTATRARRRNLAANTQNKIDEAGKTIEDIFINVSSALGATSLPGTHALIYGGKIKNWMKSLIGSDPSTTRQDQLMKIMANPDEFSKLIAREGAPANQNQFNRIFNLFVQQQAEYTERRAAEN